MIEYPFTILNVKAKSLQLFFLTSYQRLPIEEAKNRIYENDKTVNEIAYGLGFKYPQHFTRLFKQKVGMSPVEFRGLN